MIVIIIIFQGDSGGPLLYERPDGKHESIGKTAEIMRDVSLVVSQ